jgi:Probable cobalt transporter subunit (CbtA)
MGSLGPVLKAALVAGLVAGAITSGFHTLLLEPVIERAIGLEEQTSQGDAAPEAVIDRPTQRWGLVLGFLVYGALWGLSAGLLAYFVRSLRPDEWTIAQFGFCLALLIGWSMALLPFVKYPANPPGVGAADTIAYRQWLYFGFLGLSGVGTAVAVGVHHRLRRSKLWASPGRTHVLLAAAVYVIYVMILFVAMPENPDPVDMPADLLWSFRVIAFLGLVLFWAALGGAFGWLLRDTAARPPDGRALE